MEATLTTAPVPPPTNGMTLTRLMTPVEPNFVSSLKPTRLLIARSAEPGSAFSLDAPLSIDVVGRV